MLLMENSRNKSIQILVNSILLLVPIFVWFYYRYELDHELNNLSSSLDVVFVLLYSFLLITYFLHLSNSRVLYTFFKKRKFVDIHSVSMLYAVLIISVYIMRYKFTEVEIYLIIWFIGLLYILSISCFKEFLEKMIMNLFLHKIDKVDSNKKNVTRYFWMISAFCGLLFGIIKPELVNISTLVLYFFFILIIPYVINYPKRSQPNRTPYNTEN